MLYFLTAALAADVLWLGAPPDDQRAAVLAAAGGEGITPWEVRAAATDLTATDVDALRALSAALEAVRPYETQLDGELLILRDLQRPVEAVHLLRDETDRNDLFAALAYQGFAVDRYFGDTLSTSDEAAPYRTDLGGTVVATPWLDAAALEPERRVSPYDIAEAPQRVHYGETQQLVLEQLPATLVPSGLPAGSALVVDGRRVTPDATGSVKVPTGRHLVHVVHGEHVLARWDLRPEPGAEVPLEVELTDATWSAFVDSFATTPVVPDALGDALDATGGIWVARPGAKGPEVWSVTRSGAEPVDVELPKAASARAGGGIGLQLGALGGWTGSQDFYYQDPRVPATSETVNATTAGATVSVLARIGPLDVGAGIDLLVPLGEHHVANTGATSMRLRPTPHVSAGLPQAAIAVGYLFPYHPAAGLRGAVPLVGPLELRWLGWLGLPSTRERADGDYTLRPVGSAAAGVGVRI